MVLNWLHFLMLTEDKITCDDKLFYLNCTVASKDWVGYKLDEMQYYLIILSYMATATSSFLNQIYHIPILTKPL